MAKKYSRIRFWVIGLALVAGLAVIGAAAALRLTKSPDYWLSAGLLLVAVLLPILAYWRRGSSDASRDFLEGVRGDLRDSVRNQWSESLKRITDPYPLKVPFSVMTTATVDLSKVDRRPKGKSGPPGQPAAAPAPAGIELIDAMDTWPSILEKEGAESLPLEGAFEDIVTVFAETPDLPRRMVILGEPGFGKSMIAQWLTVELLASHPELDLVPVFLSLAGWNLVDPLKEWAAAEMAQTYPFLSATAETVDGERSLAYRLIDKRQVLMILDGLDEMDPDNQPEALKRLSKFALDKREFVVTCRTEEYARIVYRAGDPLAKTPVIALGPLEMDDVIQYLNDTRLLQGKSGRRWGRFLEHLETERDGPLAIAMTSSLVVWLVRTNYRRPETNPDELLAMGSAEEITEFLLDRLVDAVYSVEVTRKDAAYSERVNTTKAREIYPELEPEVREIQQKRLVYLADYLSRQLRKVDDKPEGYNRLDIEWWYLPRVVPEWFIGGTIGLVCGCLLGVCGGVAATIKFGHTGGLIAGVVLGIVAAVHAGTTSVRWQEEPRAVGFSTKVTFPRVASCLAVAIGVAVCFGFAADRGGGWLPALVTAVVVGPLCALAIRPTFGVMPAVATAISASVALGLGASLFGHRPAPLISAAAAGLAFLVSAWIFTGIFQEAKREKAISPESLLRGDRNGSLVVALTAGLAFAVVFGLALGPLVGFLAFVGLTVTAAFTVSMWGAFTMTRIWLALFRGMPFRIMAFLREAYTRGVLRRAGGAFQFRHVKLQERLAASATQPASAPVRPHLTEAAGDGQLV
jgi:hypothetical protein